MMLCLRKVAKPSRDLDVRVAAAQDYMEEPSFPLKYPLCMSIVAL